MAPVKGDPVLPDQARAIVRKLFRRDRLDEATVDDIASQALLAHWTEYRRNGEVKLHGFYADAIDAYRSICARKWDPLRAPLGDDPDLFRTYDTGSRQIDASDLAASIGRRTNPTFGRMLELISRGYSGCEASRRLGYTPTYFRQLRHNFRGKVAAA